MPDRPHARRAALLALALGAALPATGAPRLTEFMASNDRSIVDEDGDSSDWIEIHNPDPATADLSGWHLTDDPETLSKWKFPPGTSLPSDGYLLVFASGKDRAVARAELHTNFELDSSGEFLALIAPDGNTVTSSFGSAAAPFPKQRSDISYGSGEPSSVTTLLAANAPLRFLVPGSAGDLAPDWSSPTFQDQTWSSGAFAIGFDLGAPGPSTLPVDHWPLDDGFGTVIRDTAGSFPGSLIGAGEEALWDADAPAVAGGPESSLRFDGSASYVHTTFSGIGGSASRTVVFWVRTTDTTDHGIVAWGDSVANGRKFHLRINTTASNGTVGAIRCEVQGGRTVGSTIVADDRWHHLAVVFQEDATPTISDVQFYVDGILDPKSGTGEIGIDTDISGANADAVSIGRRLQGTTPRYFAGRLADLAIYDTALDPLEIAALADGTTRPTGRTGFENHLTTDLEPVMPGVNASVFARAAFDLPAGFFPDRLRLRLRYDDGFIAFLNGVEVARGNAPPAATWNASATAKRENAEALVPLEFDVSAALASLGPQDNLLAIHGLNRSAGDGDFLLGAELLGVGLGPTDSGYFIVPTPGEANGRPDAEAFVADTKFSVNRGFYEEPFELDITSATEDAEIYYTVDGSAPDPRSGRLYTAPILIRQTTTVRAVAYKDGQIPTNIDTHTYLFLDDVLAQDARPRGFPASWGSRVSDYEMDPDLIGPVYSPQAVKDSLRSLPTISVVMNVEDLFDGATGFYTNSTQRGEQWEKPCSYEFFDFPGGAQTQLNGGIRTVGRASRNANRGKHNLRAVFRSEYGPTKLRFPLFPGSEVTEFNSLILRGGNGDSWINPGVVERAQYIRDQWHRDAQRASGQPFQHQIYAHLYLNGLYWGMYHLFERFEDDMLAANFGGREEDWDAIKDAGSASALEVVNGSLDAWNRTLALANRDLANQANYEALLNFVDPDTWIDYFLMNFYSGNTDWDTSNWRAARRRESGAKWMLFAWDSERTDRNATQNTNSSTNDVTGKNVANFPSALHQKLTANAEYRLRFADRVRLHCFHGGPFSPEGAADLWDARADEIYEPLVAEAVRWGDRHRSPAARRETPWQSMLDTMHRSFFPRRTATLITQLRARGLYPRLNAPDFEPHGAAFPAPSAVTLSAPGGTTIYYTLDGTDPRRPESGGARRTLLTDGATVTASIPAGPSLDLAWTSPEFDDGEWLRGVGGVGFERDSGFESLIGLDLAAMHNLNGSAYARWRFEVADAATLQAIDALSFRAKYDDGFVAYLNGVKVASANAPSAPAWNSTATAGHPDGTATQYQSFDLTSQAGALQVGTNVLAVQCLNESLTSNDLLFVPELLASTSRIASGVSSTAIVYDGSPVRLERSARLNARTFGGSEWSALTTALYTVGTPAAPGTLVISEIMYHPKNDRGTEFIEVTNISNEHLALAGLAFTSGVDFRFPETSILAPGKRALVVQDRSAFQVAYGPNLPVLGEFENDTRLANGGERLVLTAANGAPIHDFVFGDRHPWPESADGQGASLVLVAPETDPDHADPQNWRASVAIGGSPGTSDTVAYAGGSPEALLAYALTDRSGVRVSVEDGTLSVSFRQFLAADHARICLEFSEDLQRWTPAEPDDLRSRTNHFDDTITVTYVLPLFGPPPGPPRRFARVRVELR